MFLFPFKFQAFILFTFFFAILDCILIPDLPYDQPTVHIFQYNDQEPLADWTSLPFSSKNPILQVTMGTKKDPSSFLLRENDIWRVEVNSLRDVSFQKWDIPFPVSSGSKMRRTEYHDNEEIAFATPTTLFRCHDSGASCKNFTASFGKVNDILMTKNGDLWIGSENGLFYHECHSFQNPIQIIEMTSKNILSVGFVEDFKSPIVASDDGLVWRLLNGKIWHFYRTPGIIDSIPTIFLEDDSSRIWMGNSICINIQNRNQTLVRKGGLEGLITGNITSGSLIKGEKGIWFGTKKGVMRYRQDKEMSDRDSRSYFFGPRYLPGKDTKTGQSVQSLSLMNYQKEETVIIVTETGISILKLEKWTLKEKANFYQKTIHPRNSRYGLVYGCNLQKFGNTSSWKPRETDNAGLWTSIYVASQAFRYAKTKDPNAKKEAWNSFLGMELLVNATGIKGYPARDVVFQENNPGKDWYPSPTMKGWWFKGDTSSDEIVGHLMAYPFIYDLVAETPEEKQRSYNLLYTITSQIVLNNFYLIGEKKTHTTWGIWNPSFLNGNQSWYDDRGPNSNQILSWLVSAFKISNDSLFLNAYNELVEKYGYATNIINLKITQPSDDNYSDDELTNLPYLTYLHSGLNFHKEEFDLSIHRNWRISFPQKPSLWNFIFGVSGNENFGISESIWNLQTWSLSQIDFPIENSKREDIFLRKTIARNNNDNPRSIHVLPYNEINYFRWNSNPFELDGGSGFSETDPSAFLLSYWLARYYNFLED